MTIPTGIGAALPRVDGRLKVSGQARYAGEHPLPGLLYGVAVCSDIARGRIKELDVRQARHTPGVAAVLTHASRPRVPWYETPDDGLAANDKPPFRALFDDAIFFSGQPIALVVGDTFEAARQGAMQVRAEYEIDTHNTLLDAALLQRFTPPAKKTRNTHTGDVNAALARAAAAIDQRYQLAMEHHQPMEMHATTVHWHGDGSVTVYDKNQGSQNAQRQLAQAFGFAPQALRVRNPYVGGAFGSGLRPAYQAYLAMLAAVMLERSVRVTLTRQQMFTHAHRPAAAQETRLACDARGRLCAIDLVATTGTARIETYTENVVGWGPTAYPCENVRLDYAVAPLDTPVPGNMRAPGAATGMNLFEIAMDELAYARGMDPLALRLANYGDRQGLTGLPYTSKALKQAYLQGAERFGWRGRSHAPGSMREGRERIGWGMATGIWEALLMQASATATLDDKGMLTVASAASDIGTGTCTIMAQIAAGTLGLPMDRVRVHLGDSGLPEAPLEGGSFMAASVGAAVHKACRALARQLFELAVRKGHGALGSPRFEDVVFAQGRVQLAGDPARSMAYADILAGAQGHRLQAQGSLDPERDSATDKARNTHSAVFAEVRVDEALGVARVTRMVAAVAAGRIINPSTARSQVLGGLVMGMGMALHEEALYDHRLGRIMNHNLAEYHVPCHADVHDVDILFVDEPDDEMGPLGGKGVGEIGIVGAAAAIANAIFHATGKRVRDLPITLDKLL